MIVNLCDIQDLRRYIKSISAKPHIVGKSSNA